MKSRPVKEKSIATKIIPIVIAVFMSLVLTVPSMEAIKAVPGNSFATEMDFIATTLLVLGAWFLFALTSIWLIKFLINLWNNKKNPSDMKANVAKIEGNLRNVFRILIGILNIVGLYFIVSFSAMYIVFSGLGRTPIAVWATLSLVNLCLTITIFSCAVIDLATKIKSKYSPCNKKVLRIREKSKKVFWISAIAYVCFYPLVFLLLFLLNS